MNDKTFLIELNTEEIPSQHIRNIANQFYLNFQFELKKNNIQFSKINIFDTPRRIGLIIKKINTSPILKKTKYRGPAIKYAFDSNGLLTKPALRWLQKFNITLQQTKKIESKKGSWLCYECNKNKTPIKEILINIINMSLKNINMSKTMVWNNNTNFIRPIRNIIVLLNKKLIPFNGYGVSSKQYLYGNIFNKFNKINIIHAKEYENLLYKKGQVIAKFYIRKKKIQYQIQKITQKIQGKIKITNKLIDEITGLIEWPKVLLGQFQKDFLKIPKEIIIYVMENIQKFIPIYNTHNKLTNYFIIVSNIYREDVNNVILGNERVLHARLFDIKFFIKKDQMIKLNKQFKLLYNIIFHERLGTMLDKSIRLIKLIQRIAIYTNSNIIDSKRAAYLSKCDLNTNMVYEFPELKGIIGMYYALQSGESKEIALSIKEQYKPKFSEDKLPSTQLSCALALTEKIDTIVGFFIINKIPKKDKDPFCLRRLVIGIIRIIIEKKIDFNLYEIIKYAISLYSNINTTKNTKHVILSFIINRLYSWYRNKYDINIIKAILKNHNKNLLQIDNILYTISQFRDNTLFQNLIVTYKRVFNLLKKTNIQNNIHDKINYQLFQNEEEKKLFIKINNINCILNILIKNKKYSTALKKLFELNQPINTFLNDNSIKYSKKNIQQNRIILLLKIKKLFLMIADFSEL